MQRWELYVARFLLCGLIAAAFSLTLVLWLAQPRLDTSLPAYRPPTSIPTEFQRTITLYHKDGEPYWTGDGRELYRRNHRQGWDECRYAFGMNHPWQYEPESAIWAIGQPEPVNRAREAGWKECSDRLQFLLKSESKDGLRTKILNWRRREAAWIGFGSLMATSLLMAGCAWLRSLTVAIGTIYVVWVGVMVAFFRTWDGGLFYQPPTELAPFLICLACGLVVTVAAIASNRALTAVKARGAMQI